MELFKRLSYFWIVFAIILIQGCSESITEPEIGISEKVRGGIISTNSIYTYSTDDVQFLLNTVQVLGSFDLTYSVEAVKIVYWTIDAEGNYIQASGAAMIPVNGSNLPIFNINHGTEVKRDLVASVNPLSSLEGMAGILMGSLGYLSCVPDYPGLGVSDGIHPYVHAKSNAISVIDFIRAAKTYANEKSITLNNQLFLTGYSEGGYVTLATQKEIEENHRNEFQLTAVAPMAGPYDLMKTSTELLQKTNYEWPAYLGYILTAYNDIYGWNRLNSFFLDPYGNMMETLFNGSNSFNEINSQLPKTITELLTQSFIDGMTNGTDTQTIEAFEENSLLNWSPSAPVKFYHGSADEVVPYQVSLSTIENLKTASGKNFDLFTVEGGTHATSVVPCVLDMIDWFDSFRLIHTSKL